MAAGLQVALLGGLAGLALVWAGHDRTVHLRVDGQPRTVHTFAGTVGALLSDAGVRVGPHDVVLPGLAAPLRQGQQVVVRRGRLLRLSLDGAAQRDWVTGRTVRSALAQLGLDVPGAYVSLPLGRPVGLSGAAVTVRLPQQVTVVADGRARALTTTAATVRAVLAQAAVHLRPQDRVSVPVTAYPTTGMVVAVVRVDGATVSDNVPIGFTVIRRPDPSLVRGDDPVVQPGHDGVLVRVYHLTFLNHRLAARTLVRSYVAAPPVTEVIDEGTAAPPPPPVYTSYAGLGSLNWAALANCESGGNPRAVSADGQYFGLYQFSIPTWDGVGGTGNPAQASPSEQTYRAELLYARSGASAWPVCGAYL